MSVDTHASSKKSFINSGKVRVPVWSYVTSNDGLNLHYNCQYSISVEQGLNYWIEHLAWWCVQWICQYHIQRTMSSVKKKSLRPQGLCQSVCARADLSETYRWRSMQHLAPVKHVALHSALWSLLHLFILVSQSPSSNDHSGVVANCDHRSECVHWVCTFIGIEMRWVTQWKSLFWFVLPACEMQFSLSSLYTSCQGARSICQLTILCWIPQSPDSLLVAISGITCMWLTMFPTLKTYIWTVAGLCLTCTNFEMGYKLPEFSGIVASARGN
jgi:hypothetical protein